MANQSEKKRVEREKKVGRYYTVTFLFSVALWLLKFLRDFYSKNLQHTKFGYFWRLSLVFLGYCTSLYSIFNNLKLGLEFSLSNDLFIVTTVATLLSLFFDFAYKLFLVVPLYGAYKGSVALYKWATTPAPEIPKNVQTKESKTRVKYRTIVELSSSEERSDIKVPKKNANHEESKSPTNAELPQVHSDKFPASDSGENAKDKSPSKSGKFGKSKSKTSGQSSKDKADDNKASNSAESKAESSNSNIDAAKPKLTEGEATEAKDPDSPKESGGSDKGASPKSNPDEPVLDNSPVSSDNEWSPGSFTVTSTALYHENDQGKELFVKGDYDAAIQRWSKSIQNLTTVLERARKNPGHDLTEAALHEFTKMYVILCSNLALAHIKKGAYEKCKEFCQYVLMYDDKSLKAHLRIVQADVKLRNLEQALRNCNKGLEFHPENQELLALRATINAELKSYEGVEKLFYQNAFKKIEVDPRSEQVHPPSEEDQPPVSEGDQPPAAEPDHPPPPGDFNVSPRAHPLSLLYNKVHLVVKRVFMTLSRVFRNTRSSIQHTYTFVSRPLAWFLKKVKMS
nr:hypothetical protein MACL_00003167 [Theileria orientalis]